MEAQTHAPARPVDPADLGLEVREHAVVTARDGVPLSLNLFLPAAAVAASTTVPAILNTDPYRKDDWSSGWDLSLAAYFAERGYAYARLDVRGTGSSGGVGLDEYTEAETRDGHDVVEWLAEQAWCTGSVGMWGLSYGGFTSIQVAATRPKGLKAIVPIQATDDRYTDDVHYVGGAMTVSELSQYAVSQVAMNAMPPLPRAWGDGWLERWQQRLEATPVWLFEWTRQQRDGPYWRVGSLRPEYGRIEAAILSIAGWMDEYVDAAIRMQALCTNAAGNRTIVGPWVHGFPSSAYPAPNIDWLHETVRWFDRWLKGEQNGADLEPAMTWFHREPTPPERFPKGLNGSWRATPAWLPVDPQVRRLALDAGDQPMRGRLVATAVDGGSAAGPTAGPASADDADTFPHLPTAGFRGGSLCWGAGHRPNGLAADLRLEDGAGPTYVGEPLAEPIDIFGVPVAVLHVSATRPVAHLVVRLGDVAPDGSIEQVSEGILNLTHRDSHADPAPLEPGRRYEVRVPLRAAGYRFPAGHRVYLGIASAHWPVIWPSPGPGELTIHRGPSTPSHLELPLAPLEGEVRPPAFRSEPPRLVEIGSEASEPATWETVEEADGSITIRTYEAATTTLPDGASTLFVDERLEMRASAQEPGRGRFENACAYRLDRDGRKVDIVADGTTVATEGAFEMDVSIQVDLDGQRFFERAWREVIPRDLL